MTRTLAVCMSICVLCAPAAAQESTKADSDANPLAKAVRDISFQLKLSVAIDKLAEMSGCQFDVDWVSLQFAGVKPDDKVAVRVPQARLEQLIDVVLAKAAKDDKPLAWRQTGDGIIHVSTQARILANGRNASAYTGSASIPAKASATTPPANAAAPATSRGVSFDNAPLSDVLTFLKESAGINMHVNWTALNAVNIDKNTPVTLTVSRISAAKAMDLIFDDLNASKSKMDSIYWVLDDGVVTVSTGTSLDEQTRIRVLDVGDMLHVTPDFLSPRMNLANGNQNSSNTGNNNTSIWTTNTATATTGATGSGNPYEEQSTAEMRKELREGLVKALKDSIGPDMWQPTGKGNVTLFHHKLIVSQSLLGFKLMEKAASR